VQNGGALGRDALHRLDALWAHAEQLDGDDAAEAATVAYKQYLAATATLARHEWTQFSETEMVLGITLMGCVALVQLLLLWRAPVWGAPLVRLALVSLRG
jgi:hypothetical protein